MFFDPEEQRIKKHHIPAKDCRNEDEDREIVK
jgi:hypothetical protein